MGYLDGATPSRGVDVKREQSFLAEFSDDGLEVAGRQSEGLEFGRPHPTADIVAFSRYVEQAGEDLLGCLFLIIGEFLKRCPRPVRLRPLSPRRVSCSGGR